ncbi:hypothetical protein [Aquimarina sp. 2201CG5-10]|uniref:hypothetical protein n=1 Tax=Aquimarina callyspongiae TaxID=3098150 RepID=UPI002AB4B49C|nr:hypothetical protein [Aquimarina sp. 2201CG5-10]MDY8138329.1 hypothetical protein [Aquimarina sp. 2201CG5-10]
MSKTKWDKIKEFLKGYVNTEIHSTPAPVNSELINNKVFKKIDDNSITAISDAQTSPQAIIIIPIIIFLFLLVLGGVDDILVPPSIYINIALLVIIIFGVIYYFTMPEKNIIFNRKDGLLSVPGFLWKKGFTIKFNQGKFGWVGTGGASGNLDMKLAVKHPDHLLKGAGIYGHISNFDELLSFYVWYMDKNRPLPPGNAFDPYRDLDFKRRKAEGFPPPLYRSYIPTPEATPEQQTEREQYWTDQDYTETFEREQGSELYNPEIHTDWEEVTYLKPDSREPLANTYIRFTFPNGNIIYSISNSEGKFYQPPEDLNYETVVINVKK